MPVARTRWRSRRAAVPGSPPRPSPPPPPRSATPAGAVPAPPRRLAEGALGLVSELAAAPDGSTVAVAARDGRLHVVDVASGQVSLLTEGQDGPVTGLVYAPDSAWLAWSHPGPRPLSRIRLARLADATIADGTDGCFSDSEPAFTSDGLYLAFLSVRSFDPIYDAHFFDLSFPFGSRPHPAPPGAGPPPPVAPLAGGRAAPGRRARGARERRAGMTGTSTRAASTRAGRAAAGGTSQCRPLSSWTPTDWPAAWWACPWPSGATPRCAPSPAASPG